MSEQKKPFNKIKEIIRRRKNKWEVPDLSSENYQDRKKKDTIVEYLQSKNRKVKKELSDKVKVKNDGLENNVDKPAMRTTKVTPRPQRPRTPRSPSLIGSSIIEKLMGKTVKANAPVKSNTIVRKNPSKREMPNTTKKMDDKLVTSMGSYIDNHENKVSTYAEGYNEKTKHDKETVQNKVPAFDDGKQRQFEKDFNTNIDLGRSGEIKDTSKDFHDSTYWDSAKPGVKLGTLNILDLEEGIVENVERSDVDVPSDLNEEIIDNTSELYNLEKFSDTDEFGILDNLDEELENDSADNFDDSDNEEKFEDVDEFEDEDEFEEVDDGTENIIDDEEDETIEEDDYDFSFIDDTEEIEEKATSVIPPEELIDLEETEDLVEAPKERNLFTNYELPPLDLLDDILDTKEEEQKILETAHFSECIEKVIEIMNLPMHIQKREMGSRVVKFYCPIDQTLFKFNTTKEIESRLDAMIGSTFIRYEFPLEGHSNTFGIEVPYKNVETLVQMRRAFGEIDFSTKNDISFPIGLDVNGGLPLANLETMVHLLVAGSTGSGKSVFLQSIILTFLLRANPARLKLILIDPKHVEFSKYENIPHLLAPIITDVETSILTLEQLMETMDDRYVKFRELLVKDIKSYNQKCKIEEIMPYVVIIVDEFADLMMASQDDRLEDGIKRLAAKARAAGIHMIVATQRPDSTVVTGPIKANLPTRISFKLPNNLNSRIILEVGGAEKLLGRGDMILKDPAVEGLQRIQGVFASEDEIDRIVEWVKNQDEPDFYEEFVDIKKKKAVASATVAMVSGNGSQISYDHIKAIDLILSTFDDVQTISISNIQRRLNVGHSKAGRIVDSLTDKGLVTTDSGKNKPRDIIATKEQFIEVRDEWEKAITGVGG